MLRYVMSAGSCSAISIAMRHGWIRSEVGEVTRQWGGREETRKHALLACGLEAMEIRREEELHATVSSKAATRELSAGSRRATAKRKHGDEPVANNCSVKSGC